MPSGTVIATRGLTRERLTFPTIADDLRTTNCAATLATGMPRDVTRIVADVWFGVPSSMAGDAFDTIQRFWDVQDANDYSAVVELFAEDAQLVDPIHGTFDGREAIAGFMDKMNVEISAMGAEFRMVEMDGDEHTAWAQWIFQKTDGTLLREGVGVYRVANGQLTYYKDYMNP